MCNFNLPFAKAKKQGARAKSHPLKPVCQSSSDSSPISVFAYQWYLSNFLIGIFRSQQIGYSAKQWFRDLAVTSASKDLAWTIHSLAEVAGNAACRAVLQESFPNHLAGKSSSHGVICTVPKWTSLNQFSKTLLLALKRGWWAVSFLLFLHFQFKVVTTPHCIEDDVKTLCDGQNIVAH